MKISASKKHRSISAGAYALIISAIIIAAASAQYRGISVMARVKHHHGILSRGALATSAASYQQHSIIGMAKVIAHRHRRGSISEISISIARASSHHQSRAASASAASWQQHHRMAYQHRISARRWHGMAKSAWHHKRRGNAYRRRIAYRQNLINNIGAACNA